MYIIHHYQFQSIDCIINNQAIYEVITSHDLNVFSNEYIHCYVLVVIIIGR